MLRHSAFGGQAALSDVDHALEQRQFLIQVGITSFKLNWEDGTRSYLSSCRAALPL
jgi:hypothetical protein